MARIDPSAATILRLSAAVEALVEAAAQVGAEFLIGGTFPAEAVVLAVLAVLAGATPLAETTTMVPMKLVPVI